MGRSDVTEVPSILVTDYNPIWPDLFKERYAIMWPAVQDIALTIEHIGSTSVPGLAAKPVIDMSIIVPSERELPLGIQRLANIGYQHRGNLGIEGREAFTRPEGTVAHNLYLCPQGAIGLRNPIAVRDYLRSHPVAALEYAQLKKRLAAQFPHDIESYVDGKTDFILGILRKQGFSAESLVAIEKANRKT